MRAQYIRSTTERILFINYHPYDDSICHRACNSAHHFQFQDSTDTYNLIHYRKGAYFSLPLVWD